MTSLVDKSLVQLDHTEKATRCRLLDTVRQYAAELMLANDPSDARSTADAHARVYLGLTEIAEGHLEGSNQLEWMNRIDVEQANIRSAFAYFLDHDA